jgi:hypothetical protein
LEGISPSPAAAPLPPRIDQRELQLPQHRPGLHRVGSSAATTPDLWRAPSLSALFHSLSGILLRNPVARGQEQVHLPATGKLSAQVAGAGAFGRFSAGGATCNKGSPWFSHRRCPAAHPCAPNTAAGSSLALSVTGARILYYNRMSESGPSPIDVGVFRLAGLLPQGHDG